MEESIKDLQAQLEVAKVHNASNDEKILGNEKTKEENEERIRKMKGLLIAANKKLLEYKDVTANLKKEIDEGNLKMKDISEHEKGYLKEIEEDKSTNFTLNENSKF